MKEKIIDFSNGIFAYEQAKLKTEPKELVLELDENETAHGSFVITSCDERRVKGILYSRIPGMTLQSTSFFARAARIEYIFHPQHLRGGEEQEDNIWLETSAGEYALPVKVRIRSAAVTEEKEETALLPDVQEPPAPKAFRKGPGRSEEWKKKRRQEYALLQLSVTLEKERRNALSAEEAVGRFRELLDSLLLEDPESAFYPLLDAWVMLREERREEAGWILRKYERTRLFQQRDQRIRALFLYVNSLFKNDSDTTASNVAQLQKLYAKRPEEWMLTFFLLELDPKLREKTRTRYMVLERQFRCGTRNRLLYQEAWRLLSEDPALFSKLNGFTLQVFGWASGHGFLDVEMAQVVAKEASRLKHWSPLAARLLKACYQVSPSRETAGAVCGIYIRGQRMDEEAFVWYKKGVELDAKITNLYEYFMYALPENYPQLLPRQILLYFQYHMTLTSRQKTVFYCNLVRYGTAGDEAYEAHRRQLQEFLLKQLKERKLNEDLAWLYSRCLLVETLEEDLLAALADILFLRKLSCKEKRIRQVEVSYEQLEKKVIVPLSGGCAYIPVYTPGAKIVLLDEQGRRYRQTVPYDLKRLLIEPKFLRICVEKLKDHLGLNLYLLDGKGSHRLNQENAGLAYRLVETEGVREDYRRMLKVELLEYERKHHRLEKADQRLEITDVNLLSRKSQAVYIETMILLNEDEKALELLEATGCKEVSPKLLLRLLQRLLEDETVDRQALRPYVWQVFEKGLYTGQMVELLAEDLRECTEILLKLWQAAESFQLRLPLLEEQLVVQALFTEQSLDEVFPVFQAMDDRGGDYTVLSAYLNYLSWLDFVRGQSVPEGLFASLEHHLFWEDKLAEVAALSYLKQLSVLLLLTDMQKRLVRRLMKEPGVRNRRFAFMQNLSGYLDERGRPDDQTVVEYRCNPNHKVVLHYVLEYHGKKTFDYVTEQLFPICGGVFVKSFILFYGERLTWFFTETADDGTTVSTACRTIENRNDHAQGETRYQRLCRMQRALDYHQERNLKRMMAEYEELTALVEERFLPR